MSSNDCPFNSLICKYLWKVLSLCKFVRSQMLITFFLVLIGPIMITRKWPIKPFASCAPFYTSHAPISSGIETSMHGTTVVTTATNPTGLKCLLRNSISKITRFRPKPSSKCRFDALTAISRFLCFSLPPCKYWMFVNKYKSFASSKFNAFIFFFKVALRRASLILIYSWKKNLFDILWRWLWLSGSTRFQLQVSDSLDFFVD